MGSIVLVRHGQTEWSRSGRHTSVTDLDLTDDGERQARNLAPALTPYRFTAVWCSPMRRARHTAALAGLTVTTTSADLAEWNYGRYEGVTTATIRETVPDWSIWRDGCPDGESPSAIGARLDRALTAIRPLLTDGDVAVVGHGHALRVAAARWIGLPPSGGALLGLDTASISVLGHEREQPVLRHWNLTPTP
ncbi:histidine phosphatase family protein [Stackebrandtia nassauensis]|uniref:Phosphoglycerate mutase n=1 Tax=Stackebrandtia nassauensis (strain DSM 44728 / CIP 108903 / NRRL B-16338 / NBRC 102104 / LLR-40K-21) TaxID=446470 RepID=D3QBR8_STANL|nr:histidine phosphatase family protein [Stackebrandtia nassauensis]ADD44807.1 Phosphoglycerate mutase [Stackebrandtia nassauensis DSM 44728]